MLRNSAFEWHSVLFDKNYDNDFKRQIKPEYERLKTEYESVAHSLEQVSAQLKLAEASRHAALEESKATRGELDEREKLVQQLKVILGFLKRTS